MRRAALVACPIIALTTAWTPLYWLAIAAGLVGLFAFGHWWNENARH